ncbi:MAG: DUF2778 domain-containing protein [Xanthobacteraceae bacterium]
MGDILVRLGVPAIPLGVAAVVLGIALKSAGTQAGPIPADSGLGGSSLSVFGTIHPDIFRLRTPIGSGLAEMGVRVASLETPGSDAPPIGLDMLADPAAAACRNAAFDDRPASFDKRFAAVDDCPVTVNEKFGSAMQKVALNLRPADQEAVTIDQPAAPLAKVKPMASLTRTHVRPGHEHRAVTPIAEDDGHTAIYDISAHMVYLPDGKRLEAHSGLGEFMDNPKHVRMKMRGPTPTNLYKLTMRERVFHGVRALRLNPVNEARMHGRDGILAHTYMLGSKGASNGCVSFKDYPEFLDAFLKGEVTRLVVVEKLANPPTQKLAGWLPDEAKQMIKASLPDDSEQQVAAVGDQ